jgi:hypothetical protein
LDRPTVGHFSAGEIMHTAIGPSLRIFQEQAMEVAFRALKRHGIVSERTTVQLERCLWDQISSCSLARWSSFGSSYSLHVRHLRRLSGRLRSLRRQPAGQLDWFTGVLAASVDWFLPRSTLARLQIWADLSAVHHEPSNPSFRHASSQPSCSVPSAL